MAVGGAYYVITLEGRSMPFEPRAPTDGGLAHVTQASCHVLPEDDGFDPAEVYALTRAWPGLTFFAAPTMATLLL